MARARGGRLHKQKGTGRRREARAQAGGAGRKREVEAGGGRAKQLENGNELHVSEGSRVMRVPGLEPILSLDGRTSIIPEIHLLARCHKPSSNNVNSNDENVVAINLKLFYFFFLENC